MNKSSIQLRQVKLKYAFQTSLGPFHLGYIAAGYILIALKTINQRQEAEKCLIESCLLDINMPIYLSYVTSTPFTHFSPTTQWHNQPWCLILSYCSIFLFLSSWLHLCLPCFLLANLTADSYLPWMLTNHASHIFAFLIGCYLMIHIYLHWPYYSTYNWLPNTQMVSWRAFWGISSFNLTWVGLLILIPFL